MFGTLGFSELIIILVIVLIIFGAGRLPQIGEGVGKALRGFKKEVHDVPPPEAQGNNAPQPPVEEAHVVPPSAASPAPASPAAPSEQQTSGTRMAPAAPYRPGPELTPGTTAALAAAGVGPQMAAPPKPKTPPPTAPAAAASASHSDPLPTPPPPQASYPPLPPGAKANVQPPTKRPSAVVNKAAVARVQAQQAAMKKAPSSGVSPQDMQGLGESLGDALRTFRQAAADVRNSVDPSMRTIQAEMDAAKKEIEQSMEAAKQMPAVHEDPPDKKV